MSVSGKLVLAIKMLLESQQYKAELNQAVSDTQAAAAKVEGTTKGIHEAVQSAVQGQSAVVRGAAGALVSMGAVAGTAVVAAAAVGLAYHEAGKETKAYEKAIISTGNAAGVTAGQLADMARGIDNVAGTQATAAAALATMTATGQVARENLQKVSLAAVEMERATGQSITDTAKIFESLGDAPVKASVRLNESMNYLTAGTYAQIKAADELGDKETAASIAQNAAADALRERAARVEQHLGTLERAWRGVRDFAKEAWDAMLNVGREQTSGEKLETVRKRIADLENKIAASGGFGETAGGAATGRPNGTARMQAELQGLQAQAAALAGAAYQASESANAERERAAAVKASIALSDEAGKRDSDLEKTRKAVAQATQQYTTAIKNEGLSTQERAQIEANYLKIVSDLTKVKEKNAAARKAGQTEEEREAATIANLSGLTGDYQQKLKELQSARAKGNISEEYYLELVEALIAKQPMAKQLMDAQTKATTAAEKATLELAKARDKALVAQGKELEKAQAALVLQEEQNARLGLSKEAIAELDAAKLDMLATDLELQAIKVMDKNLDEQQYEALMRQANAWREVARAKREGGAKQAGIDAANDAKKASEEWERAGERIEQSLTDSLMRGFESGKTAAQNLRDTVDNMFKTLVLRPGISALMSPVAAGVQSFFNGGAPGGGSGGSAASTVMSAASMFGAGGLGGSMAAGAGWLTGATTLSGSLSAGMSLLGTGTMAGSMSGLGMIAGALGPIALGVGAVVSLVKKLDDSGTIHTGALSQYSAAGGLANSTTHGAFGMGFGGVDYSAETEKFTGAMAQSIVQMLDSTATTFGKEAGYKAATAFADDTSKDGAWGGLLITKLEETIVNWDPTRTSRWAPKEFADGAAGKEQYLAAVAADVRVALDSIGLPAWATGMLDKLGQGASIEQLAGAVDQINAAKAAFASFGQYMPTFAGLADSAISKLVDASGGAQALAGNMATFVDQFYSDADKLAVNTENVRAAMGRLGFEMPRTRAEFAALVQANVALGDAGAETVAKLLQVAGAFAQVTPAVESASAALEAEARAKEETARAQQQAADDAARRAQEIARERYGLETELYTLLDNTNKLRERELATLDSSNRALKEFIYSLQDAFAAVDNAFATVQRSVAAQKNALAAEFEAGQAQRQKALSDAQSVSGLVDNISRAISNAVAAQSIDSKAFDVARRSQAQARLDGFLAALRAGGSVTELPGLDRVLGTLGKDSKAGFGRFEDYAFDRGVTAGKLAELGQLADAQKTVAEKTLEEITAGNEAAQTAYAAQQAALDATLAQAQSMYDAMKGIDTSVMSVAAAMQQFSETLINLEEIRSERSVQRALMQQGSGTAAARQSREFTDAELIALGFDPKTVREEAAWNTQQGGSRGREGLEGYINGLVNSGSDMLGWMLGAGGQLSQYAGSVPAFNAAQYIAAAQLGGKDGITQQELQTILGISGSAGDNGNGTLEQFLKDMPKFADGGIHAGGWRLVGERGPELEYTPPSRIYNAADTVSLLQSGGASTAEIAAALREMAARLEAVEANSRAAANASAATQRQLQGVVQNGAIRVRTVA